MTWVVVALLAAAPTTESMFGAADPERPLSERLEAVSAKFLGTVYVASPLGEGKGKDPDPLVRYDAVDCLTFVEEAIALSLAASSEAVVPLLTRIRYEGESPDFETRNHVMEAQWVPSNLKKGFLIHKKTGLFLRHASRSFGKVVDEPLANYLGRNLAYARWTVEGVSLYAVQPARAD